MSSLKTIILKYLLVCVFLISPCCVHRDRRPDQTVSVVPSPRFVLFVFSSLWLVPVFVPRGKRVRWPRALMPAVRGSLRRRSRLSHPAICGSSREFTPPFAAQRSRRSREFTPPFAAQRSHAAVRGSAILPFTGVHAAVRGSTSPPFVGDDDDAVHG